MRTQRSLGMSSADVEQWDEKYSRADPPPWEIDGPQPVVVELARSGQLLGRVLDVGCGSGENTIIVAQHGALALGVDLSPRAIEQAAAKARAKRVAVRFQVADALRLDRLDEVFDAVIDSGTFQAFFNDDMRALYASSLANVVRPGGVVFLTCVSDRETSDRGPRRVSEAEIRSTFARGWMIEELQECVRQRRVGPFKAWLARIRRVWAEPGETTASSRFVYRHESRRPLAFEPVFRAFEPSFYIPPLGGRGFLSERHQRVPTMVADIDGRLGAAELYKLYEAAYFSRGTIVELGGRGGQSTVVLAIGVSDGGRGVPFHSTQLQDEDRRAVEQHLRERGLLGLVTLVCGDHTGAIGALPGRFNTVFVNGELSYDGTMRNLDALAGRIEPGGVVMFRDTFHPANANGKYGVAQALDERSEELALAYRGRFGAAALYEHVPGLS
jgi:SAM-dependent methyltransferase